MIIDAHLHLIPRIHGQNRFGHVRPLGHGLVRVADESRQMLPDFLEDSLFPLDSVISLMNRHHVSKAILLQNPTFGILNQEITDAIVAYPDRFYGTIQVDPTDPKAPQIITHFAGQSKQTLLKLEMSEDWGWTGLYPDLKLDGPEMGPIWQIVHDQELKVIIDTGPVGNKGYQIEEIGRLAEMMPNNNFLIEHLGYLLKGQWGNTDLKKQWHECIQLAQMDNVYLGFSAVSLLLHDSYPCPDAIQLLKEAIKLAGDHKIIWGSDAPGTLIAYSYQQMIDTIQKSDLDSNQKKKVFSENAESFLSKN